MNLFIGIFLILGMMILIFHGPEWVVKINRKPKRFRRLVRLDGGLRKAAVAGRRRANRFGGSPIPS